jgi:hypothetical protein
MCFAAAAAAAALLALLCRQNYGAGRLSLQQLNAKIKNLAAKA